MKKFLNIFLIIMILIFPVVGNAKANVNFDWRLDNRFFLYEENNVYYFLGFDFSVNNEYLYSYDKDGKSIDQINLYELRNNNIQEYLNSDFYEKLNNYFIEVSDYFYDEESKTDYSPNYYNGEFNYLDDSSFGTIAFEENLEFTKKYLGKKYDLYVELKDENINILDIRKFGDTYMVYLRDENYDYLYSFYNSKFENIFTIQNDVFDDGNYFERCVTMYDDLIYVMSNIGIVDVYKLDGTLYDSITIKNDDINEGIYFIEGEYVPAEIFVDKNNLFVLYEKYVVPNRIINHDVNDLPREENASSFILKYSLNYEVEKVQANNGDSTYTIKTDEDGRKYAELDIKPNSGYSVENIVVLDSNGKQIEVKNNKFYLPQNDVKVEVTFTQGEYVPIPDTSLNKNLTIILIGIILISLGAYTISYVKSE